MYENVFQELVPSGSTIPEEKPITDEYILSYCGNINNYYISKTFDNKKPNISNDKDEIRKVLLYTEDAIRSKKESKNVSHYKNIVSEKAKLLGRNETLYYFLISLTILCSLLSVALFAKKRLKF